MLLSIRMAALWHALACGTGPSTDPSPPVPAAVTTTPAASTAPPSCAQGEVDGCFLLVQGGNALIGAQADDPNAPGHDPFAQPDEGPPQRVAIESFWLQKHEASAASFQRCIDDGGCSPDTALTEGGYATAGQADKEHLPIVGLTAKGAEDLCAWFGGRLPTEAEWEFAARGADAGRFPWGDALRCPDGGNQKAEGSVTEACHSVIATLQAELPPAQHEALTEGLAERMSGQAMIDLCGSLRGKDADTIVARIEAETKAHAADEHTAETCAFTGPVAASFQRSKHPLGFTGMAGNVAEWTSSLYSARHGAGTVKPALRVLRGGSWMAGNAIELRAARRDAMAPHVKLPDVGVRCAWAP